MLLNAGRVKAGQRTIVRECRLTQFSRTSSMFAGFNPWLLSVPLLQPPRASTSLDKSLAKVVFRYSGVLCSVLVPTRVCDVCSGRQEDAPLDLTLHSQRSF